MSKNLFSVIKYDGDDIIYKHPIEDFNKKSLLIVNPSQEAYVYFDGKLWGPYPEGQTELYSRNIPGIKGFLSYLGNGISTFHCVVLFVNKKDIVDLSWGVGDITIPIYDPEFSKSRVVIGVSGKMTICVEEGDLLINRLIGPGGSIENEEFEKKIQIILNAKIKGVFNSIIVRKKINVFYIDSVLAQLGYDIQNEIEPVLSEYGLFVKAVDVHNVIKDPTYYEILELYKKRDLKKIDGQIRIEESQIQSNERIVQAIGESRSAIIRAESEREIEVGRAKGEKESLDILGTNYQEKEAFNIVEKAVSNPGAGNMTSLYTAGLTGGAYMRQNGVVDEYNNQVLKHLHVGNHSNQNNIDDLVPPEDDLYTEDENDFVEESECIENNSEKLHNSEMPRYVVKELLFAISQSDKTIDEILKFIRGIDD